jgi:DNA-binding IclR family transcriptional regulator
LPTDKRPTIGSLERGIDLLEILAERGSAKLAELPELLGSSRATAFRLLATLQERGYVEHVASEHTYRLGPGAVILAARSQTSSLVRMAEPAMAELREMSGETVNLALFRGGRLIYAQIVEGGYALRMSGTVGEEAPLHATALGKSVLATLPPEQRQELLGRGRYESLTANTRTSWAALSQELDATAERGYAVEIEENDMGAACVAAAIVDGPAHPIGAISVSGPAGRFDTRHRDEMGELVARRCAEISASFGWSSGDGAGRH